MKAARDLVFNLETKMDKLRLDLANSESLKKEVCIEKLKRAR